MVKGSTYLAVGCCIALGLLAGYTLAEDQMEGPAFPNADNCGCRQKTSDCGCGHRTMSVSERGFDEAPFVEGQPPPAAEAGSGWKLVCIPATFKTVTQQVEINPAHSYAEILPAKFETREETVQVAPETKKLSVVPAQYKCETFQELVKPESTRYEVIPAKYEMVEEEVVLEPERQELKVIPARYRCETEQVEVSPEHGMWVKDGDNCDPACGNKYCWQVVPAKFCTVTKQVLDSEATTETVTIPAKMGKVCVRKLVADAIVNKVIVPAEYTTVERRVLDTPADVVTETIPAKFETIRKAVMVEPESKNIVEIPAKYETTCTKVLDTPEQLVWQKINCGCVHIKSCGCENVSTSCGCAHASPCGCKNEFTTDDSSFILRER